MKSALSKASKLFTAENIVKPVLEAKYAVRGKLHVRADDIRQALKKPNHGFPFDKIIACNIGNPQEVEQKPITFHRQVLASCLYPQLLHSMNGEFPNDVIQRSKKILNHTPCQSIGAYTHSQGINCIRESVVNFIAKRDNTPNDIPNIDNIFITDGASAAIKYVLKAIVNSKSDGVLLPIPQYPLYSATVSLLNGSVVPYYLHEEDQWSFQIEDALNACKNAKKFGIIPKALVIINPGNPTGQILSEKDIKQAIQFAKDEKVIILADEVYQSNVYGDRPFISFRKVLKSMGDEYNDVELFSFHSVSKGVLGECGLRGGYVELTNIEQSGKDQLYKLASIDLCPNTIGQISVDLMCNPPQKGDASYQLYNKEYTNLFDSLVRRANIVSNKLNKIDGIDCQPVAGAMYAYPTIHLPQSIIDYAQNVKEMEADMLYCFELLEKEGICCVPGSGFGQVDGTYHFRTTILPPENEIEHVCDRLEHFHYDFIKQFS